MKDRTKNQIDESYLAFIETLKTRVLQARTRASLAVNHEMVLLYWTIGRDILEQQKAQNWGSKIIDQLSDDLRKSFPEMKGFSARNLKYMRAFADAWPDEAFVQQLVAQIPWGHNLRILDKVESSTDRTFYIKKTIENNWSRNILILQIEQELHLRQGMAINNFAKTLPSPQSDLAQALLKDPYCFDFLSLTEDAKERDLEKALVNHIRDFLVELGVGFAFMGLSIMGGKELPLPLEDESKDGRGRATLGAEGRGEGDQSQQVGQKDQNPPQLLAKTMSPTLTLPQRERGQEPQRRYKSRQVDLFMGIFSG